MFKLTIKTDNAAFGDGNMSAELARILRDAANQIEAEGRDGHCRDSNGNHVGQWQLGKSGQYA